MTAIWSNDGQRWALLTPSGFPDEASLHSLIEQSPQLLPLAGSPRLTIVGREVRLGSGSADLIAVEPNGRLSAYLQFWRSVFERRAPQALAAVEAAVGEQGVRQGNVVREVSDELLSALTVAYEEAATGQLST